MTNTDLSQWRKGEIPLCYQLMFLRPYVMVRYVRQLTLTNETEQKQTDSMLHKCAYSTTTHV